MNRLLSIFLSLSLSRSVLLLLKNPTFLFLCLAGATEATLIAGMSTFGPKFLESQFSLSASEAATWFGELQKSQKYIIIQHMMQSPEQTLMYFKAILKKSGDFTGKG